MTGGLGQFDAVFNILILVVAITLVARQVKFPSTIAFIFAGLMAAALPRFPIPELSSELFISLLLPPILFNETLTLDIEGLIDDSDTILSYAIIGTIIMVVAVAVYTHLALELTWMESFLIGIIVAPTDPVSIIATFKRLGVIKRFQLIVGGESLFNDGVAIVIYTIIVTVLNSGIISGWDILQITIISVVGGVLLGYIAGYLIHLIFCWTDDVLGEVLLSFIVAFGVYRLAEQLQASGIIAIVVAGLLLNYRCRTYGGISREMSETLGVIWEFVGFIATSFAFIFIGVSIEPNLLFAYIPSILGLVVFSLGFRYIMVEIVANLLETYRNKRIPSNWRRGITWSGLRGAVSVVLVLGVTSLPLPNVDKMLALTYGLVLGTNVIQGLSMPWVVSALHLLSSRVSIESKDKED